MNKKGLNIQSKLYSFSILDDEYILEQNMEQSVHKIQLYSVMDFYCYNQAIYDLSESFIKDKNMIGFAHLLNIYNNNIFIARTHLGPNGKRVVIDFTNIEYDDEWNPVSYAKQHIQHVLDRLVSVNFNPNHHNITGYFDYVYISDRCTPIIHVIYNILSIPVHHTQCIIEEFSVGKYRDYDEYAKYTDILNELLRIETE